MPPYARWTLRRGRGPGAEEISELCRSCRHPTATAVAAISALVPSRMGTLSYPAGSRIPHDVARARLIRRLDRMGHSLAQAHRERAVRVEHAGLRLQSEADRFLGSFQPITVLNIRKVPINVQRVRRSLNFDCECLARHAEVQLQPPTGLQGSNRPLAMPHVCSREKCFEVTLQDELGR